MTENKKVSPIAVQKSLKGMDYPTKKETLVSHARNHQASEDVLEVLSRLPEKEYASAKEVQKAVGDAERSGG